MKVAISIIVPITILITYIYSLNLRSETALTTKAKLNLLTLFSISSEEKAEKVPNKTESAKAKEKSKDENCTKCEKKEEKLKEISKKTKDNEISNNPPLSNEHSNSKNMDYSTNLTESSSLTNITILHSPYYVNSCDQVLMVKGKYLKNLKNYQDREDAFFTISVYMTNVFNSKSSAKLIQSIPTDSLKALPVIIQGSDNCILFSGSKGHSPLTMCPESKIIAEELLTAFQFFVKCRMGRTLEYFPQEKIERIFKASYLGMKVTYNKKTGLLKSEDPTVIAMAAKSAIESALAEISKKAQELNKGKLTIAAA